MIMEEDSISPIGHLSKYDSSNMAPLSQESLRSLHLISLGKHACECECACLARMLATALKSMH